MDLIPRHLCGIGARAFVRIERRTEKLASKAVEWQVVRCNNDSESYRVYNPATPRIMERRDVAFLKTPPCPTSPRELQFMMHRLPPSDEKPSDSKGHNSATDDNFLRELRDDTFILAHLAYASTDGVTISGISRNPRVAIEFYPQEQTVTWIPLSVRT